MPWHHGALGFVLRVVRHIRRGVEQGANAMTAVSGDDGTLRAIRDDCNLFADIPVHGSGPDSRDRHRECLVRNLHQMHRGLYRVECGVWNMEYKISNNENDVSTSQQ
jgi:hypothetical protein